MTLHLITTCSAGKTVPTGNTVFPYQITDTAAALAEWRERAHASGIQLATAELYRGHHWPRAMAISARHAGTELWVISAGLGLRHQTDPAVPYESTFSRMPCAASDIWSGLTQHPPLPGICSSLARLMRERPHDRFVIAGSPVYLAATEHDLLQGIRYLDNVPGQLTVITSGAYRGELPSVTFSHAGILSELNTNMVGLNISLAGKVINSLLSETA